jgi:hypothetical protein
MRPENLMLTVRKVLAWRVRKPDLPLLLDSTADIVDAVLQDESGGLEHNALRLVYAAAIQRYDTFLFISQLKALVLFLGPPRCVVLSFVIAPITI